MKKSLKPLVLTVILLGSMAVSQLIQAQAPPPPPPSGPKGGSGNNTPGGTAPIEGGVIVSLALIAGFGGWKLYKGLQSKKQDVQG